jgi:hypothetical protein
LLTIFDLFTNRGIEGGIFHTKPTRPYFHGYCLVCLKKIVIYTSLKGVEVGRGGQGTGGEVAQTMYTQMNKYKNNKKRKKIQFIYQVVRFPQRCGSSCRVPALQA